MARGAGTIEETPHGYLVRVYVNGKRVSRRAKTQPEAVARLAELLKARQDGIAPGSARLSLAELLQDWLRHGEHVKGWRRITLRGHRSRVQAIAAALGHRPVAKLTPARCSAGSTDTRPPARRRRWSMPAPCCGRP